MERLETRSPEYISRSTCRACDGELHTVLDMGSHKLPAFAEEPVDIKVPLEVCLCNNCHLFQLRHTTKPELLWNESYGFKSGVNEAIIADHENTVSEICKTVQLRDGDTVIDIGSNDSTLLKNYPLGITPVGYEPSKNVAYDGTLALKEQRGVNFAIFKTFFDKWPYLHRFGEQKAKAVTAISMFYDLEDPNKFLSDVHEVLHDEGVFVIQQNYLAGMLENCSFDNICHEHLEYYSLTSLLPLVMDNGFEVVDVTESSINGGSFRTYLKKTGSSVVRDGGGDRVLAMLQRECQMGLNTPAPYERFAERVRENGSQLKGFIKEAVQSGKSVYVYGASTRGGTILQSYGLDNTLLTAAVERNPNKWGKIMSTANIPIISEEQARGEKPDYMLILPWFFADVFIDREQEYLSSGGSFIVPLPEFRVVTKDATHQKSA